jgi:hypothetical protein
MSRNKTMRWSGAVCLGLVCGAFGACAGSDRPEPTDAQAEQIAAIYVNGDGTPAGGAAGAGGSGDGSGGSSMSSGGAAGGGGAGECDAFAILAASCSGTACHGAGSTVGNFAESLEIAEGFVDVPPVPGEDCEDYENPVIDTENPQQSLLVQKVNGAAPCGLDMPLTPTPLTDDEVDCLVEWIGTL